MPTPPLTPAERAQLLLLRSLVALPAPLKRGLLGAPPALDGQVLDLDTHALLRLMALAPEPPKSALTPDGSRERMRRATAMLAGPPLDLDAVENLTVAGTAGPLAARLFVPVEAAAPRALLVYLHGGGWVSGDLDTHDGPCRLLAHHAGVSVLAVHYRRAPEHRFPVAVEDAFAALRWVFEHAGALGADASRIAVGGDSAGGNLAAVASHLARDAGERVPALQLLIYPVTDLSEKRPSYRLFQEGFYLTEGDMDWYRDHYLGTEGATGDPRVSPLLAEDLSALPSAYVVTAGFDPLRDEGEVYAARLQRAGVRVALRRQPGLIHGFANLTALLPAARAAMLEAAGALRMGLAGGSPQAGGVR